MGRYLSEAKMYKTDISNREWFIYDILGNAGWIAYFVAFVRMIFQNNVFEEGSSSIAFTILELICALGILSGLVELISERIAKLDRILSKRRLYRGFGMLTVSSLLAAILTWIQLIQRYFAKAVSGNTDYIIMLVGSFTCYLFSALLFVQYRKQSSAKEKHLPMYGVGPFYVYTSILLSLVGITFARIGLFSGGEFPIMKIPFTLIGSLLIIGGGFMWYASVIKGKIDKDIEDNHLATGGMYAIVRNPIYTGISFVCIGVLFVMNNVWLLILPLVFWGFLTALMKGTEEKWLRKQYGDEYDAYCKRVNRFIPWNRTRRK